MIILDTHIWVWWVHQDDRLPRKVRSFIAQQETRSDLVTMDQRILSYAHVPLARME